MQEQMHVSVNESGEQSDIAEVDHLCALRTIHGDAHLANALAFNKDFAGLEQGSGVDLEQARSVEDDGGRGLLLRRGNDCRKTAECAN
jgi:hypothetical protein